MSILIVAKAGNCVAKGQGTYIFPTCNNNNNNDYNNNNNNKDIIIIIKI